MMASAHTSHTGNPNSPAGRARVLIVIVAIVALAAALIAMATVMIPPAQELDGTTGGFPVLWIIGVAAVIAAWRSASRHR